MDTTVTISHYNRIAFFKGANDNLLSPAQIDDLSKQLATTKKMLGEVGSQERLLAQEYLLEAIEIISDSPVILPKSHSDIFASGYAFYLIKPFGDEGEGRIRIGATSRLTSMKAHIENKIKAYTAVLLFVKTQKYRELEKLIGYLLRDSQIEKKWYRAEPVYNLFDFIFQEADLPYRFSMRD